MFDFIRRYLAKSHRGTSQDKVIPQSSAPLEETSFSIQDEELRMRHEKLAQGILEKIRKEQAEDLLLSPEDRLKKSMNLPRHLNPDDCDLSERGFVTILNGAGISISMERETYDYMYGHSTLPNPSQGDLDELLARVVRFRVLACSQVVLDTNQASVMKNLQKCLQINEDPDSFGRILSGNTTTLELYGAKGLIDSIILLSPITMRWKRWKHDAWLRSDCNLGDYFRECGLNDEQLHGLF